MTTRPQITRVRGFAQHGQMLDVLGAGFDDDPEYSRARPDAEYVQRLLGSDSFVAFVAYDGPAAVGAIAGYELVKFEQARSEFYLYDLAVLDSHRRQGIAKALIRAFQGEAARRGALVTFVQADLDDPPAIALYESLGTREEVLHFDLDPPDEERPGRG